MKILHGLNQPTAARFHQWGGAEDALVYAIACGIGMVQQHFMLPFPFTAAENIVYGHEPKSRTVFFNRRKR